MIDTFKGIDPEKSYIIRITPGSLEQAHADAFLDWLKKSDVKAAVVYLDKDEMDVFEIDHAKKKHLKVKK